MNKWAKAIQVAPKYAGGGYSAGGSVLSYADGGEVGNASINPENLDAFSRQLQAIAQNPMPQAATTQPTTQPAQPTKEAARGIAETQGSTPLQQFAQLAGLSGAQGNLAAARGNANEWMENLKGNYNEYKNLVDKYKQQMSERNNRPDLSPLAQLADIYYGTNLAKNYQKPLTQEQQTEELMKAQEGLTKMGQPIAQDLLKEQMAENTPLNQYYKAMTAGAVQQNRNLASAAKEGKDLDSQQIKFVHDLNPLSGQYGTALSNLGQKIGRARNAEAFIRMYPNGEVQPQEMTELANTMASLISGQNRVPYELVKDLTPRTGAKDFASFAQWVTNNPGTYQAKAFMDRMGKVISREKEIAAQQIAHTRDLIASGYTTLQQKRPEQYEKSMGLAAQLLNIPGLDSAKDPEKLGILAPPVPGAIAGTLKGKKIWLLPDLKTPMPRE